MVKFYFYSIIIFHCLLLNSCFRETHLKEKGQFGSAKVIELYEQTNKGAYGTYSLTYKFYFKGKEYKGDGSLHKVNYDLKNKLFIKSFPVIYLPDNPEVSSILITRYDFEVYNLEFPDSLKWIEK